MASISTAIKGSIPYLLILLAVYFLRFEAFEYLNTRYIGGYEGDAGLYVWLTKSFANDPWQAIHLESNAFFPYALSRAWSDNFLLPSFIASAFHFIGVGEILSYNLVILIATFLNGAITYRLSRKLEASMLGSILAGLGFMSTSYLSAHLGHPQLQFAFFIPLGALLLIPEDRTPLSWFAFGLVLSCAFYTTVYYAIFLALFFIAAVIHAAFTEQTAQVVKNLFWVGIGAFPVCWALPFYLTVKEAFNERGLFEAFYFSATGISYITHPQFSKWYGATQTFSHTEAQLGSGFVLLISSAFALWSTFRESTLGRLAIISVIALVLASISGPAARNLTAILTWIALITVFIGVKSERVSERKIVGAVFWFSLLFFTLSLGPLGNSAKGELAFGPFSALYHTVPGVDAIRAVGRFGIITVLGFYLANALFLSKQSRIVCVAVFLLSIAENRHTVFPIEGVTARPEVAEGVPSGSVALSLPMANEIVDKKVVRWGEFARLNVNAMNWFVGSGVKLLNGYSGQRTKLMLELPGLTKDFPNSAAIKYLSQFPELQFIVINSNLIEGFSEERFNEELKKFPSLEVLRRGNDHSILLAFHPKTALAGDKDGSSIYLANPKRSFTVVSDSRAECVLSVRCSLDKTIEEAKVGPTQAVPFTQQASFVPSCPIRSLSVRPYVILISSTCQADVS